MYTKASLVVALCDEGAVAAEAARLVKALEKHSLCSMKEEICAALQCIAPTDELLVAHDGVYEACLFVVSVYADLAADSDLVDGNISDAQLEMEIGLLMHADE